ncbi:MAG: hypothetical protein Q8M29_04130 [Bacteroidota bacterium]|nr:hypothetical protein [Bacteroidota bacterium]
MNKLIVAISFLFLSFVSLSKNLEETTTKDIISEANSRVSNSAVTVKVPKYIFSGLNTNIDLVFNDPNNQKLIDNNYELFFIINGQDTKIHFDKSGVGSFSHTFNKSEDLRIYFEDFSYSANLHIISLWYIVVPVGLLVLFLGYKLFRTGKKNKVAVAPSAKGVELLNIPVTEEGTPSEEKVKIKEVVEKEEEVFA